MQPLEPYSFSPIFNVILSSQRNKKRIRNEFKKMVEFFLANPDSFFLSLENTKEAFERKSELTEEEELTLADIRKVIEQKVMPNTYFVFSEHLLLDDFSKIFTQIKERYPVGTITDNKEVEILFYSLNFESEETSLGEVNSIGQINTGSKICIEKMTVKAKDFVTQYQMLCN